MLWGISRDDVYWDEWASDVIDGLPEMVLSDDLRDVIDVMQAEGVELPDPAPVAAMRFEGDGRGAAFDARPLSRIL